MNPTPGSVFYEPPLAAMPQLKEKPRQGFATWKTAWNPGPNVANSTAAIGMRAGLVLEGVRKTYRARYYNPTTGRFLSEDPIGFAGGINLYAYAKNNPLKFNDPLGTCANSQGLPSDDPLFSDACNSALMLLMLSATVAFFYISMAIIFLPMIFGAWFAEFAELEALETLFALISHAADTPRIVLLYLLLFPIAPILGFAWAYNNVMNSCGGN